MSARGLIIGAPRSGAGKTSVTIGLMRALQRQGFAVRGAKSGPDYIDPGFHAAATLHQGVNVDSWAMAPDLLDHLVTKQISDADFLIVESAMGLFDGIQAEQGRSGSVAELARRYDLPTLLVLDISGQSQTASVIAHGFATYDPSVRIAGVVLNQVASERHEEQARAAIEARGIKVAGAIYRSPQMSLPERHLGLVQASEHAALEEFIERLADIVETSLDLELIKQMATPLSIPAGDAGFAVQPPAQRIAIASDQAFSFLYPHVARFWREAGAELIPFSPLANEAPDPSCDLCWLPGGYPELHGETLSSASSFLEGLRDFAKSRPVHGECGGFMVLGRALIDAQGRSHEMAGLLDHVTSFEKRKINLGYREAHLLADSPIGAKGSKVRGHEFHYSRLVEAGQDERLAELYDGRGNALGPSGARRGQTTGTYFHAIAAS